MRRTSPRRTRSRARRGRPSRRGSPRDRAGRCLVGRGHRDNAVQCCRIALLNAGVVARGRDHDSTVGGRVVNRRLYARIGVARLTEADDQDPRAMVDRPANPDAEHGRVDHTRSAIFTGITRHIGQAPAPVVVVRLPGEDDRHVRPVLCGVGRVGIVVGEVEAGHDDVLQVGNVALTPVSMVATSCTPGFASCQTCGMPISRSPH